MGERAATLVAGCAVLGVGAVAWAQSGPTVQLQLSGLVVAIVGGTLSLVIGIAGWGLKSFLSSQFDATNHGIAQLHARIGELKVDHGSEIMQLRARQHEMGNHVAINEATIAMHIKDKGAHNNGR